VHARLAAQGVAVRRFASEPRLARHLRITVGAPPENDALIDALRATL
jgi:histidinol-phosphate/aromatic aminotransferase/cobyric acid decarboxylase-like protein